MQLAPQTTPEAIEARRGRPATASRADVVAMARNQYLAGERVDLTVIARRLGLGRATIYRWFGSRDAVIASELELLIARHRRSVRQRGAAGLLKVFDRVNRSLSRSTALRALLEQERDSALRLLTTSGGPVQPRSSGAVQALIDAEVDAGRYEPPTETSALAYAIVRLAEAFLYNDTAIGIRGDWERLHQVEAALLGVAASEAGTRSRKRSGRGRFAQGRSAS
jgi:AcrR family transcriptional regulator